MAKTSGGLAVASIADVCLGRTSSVRERGGGANEGSDHVPRGRRTDLVLLHPHIEAMNAPTKLANIHE